MRRDRVARRVGCGSRSAPARSPATPIHPDCVAAVEHTAAAVESLGHEVVPADPHDRHRALHARAWSDIVACGTQLTVRPRAAAAGSTARPTTTSSGSRAWPASSGAPSSGAEYLAAIDVVHAVGRQMARFLVPYDMLLTATLGEPPALIGRFATDRADGWTDFLDYRLNHVLPYSPFTALANGTGQPAMSVPLWWNDAGLPVGTHFMAQAGDDHVLLQLAAQLEQADPWFHRRPLRCSSAPVASSAMPVMRRMTWAAMSEAERARPVRSRARRRSSTRS